jgi:hypothetical protein
VPSQFPDWAEYVEGGDIEAVPPPRESQARNPAMSTPDGKDLCFRCSPPRMAYPVGNELELVNVVKQLVSQQASFAVGLENEEWKETTLLKANEIAVLNPGQHAQIVSRFSIYGREVA